jgi:HEAT repeats
MVVTALLEILHDNDNRKYVREKATEILGEIGAGDERVVTALLEALHDRNSDVRRSAVTSLGHLGIKDTTQLYQILVTFNRCLHDADRGGILKSINQLLDGRPIPGYRWVSLLERRAQKRRLMRIAFWFGTAACMALLGLAATWLFGALDPNGFLIRFLTVLAGIVAFVAAVAQVLGRTLRGPWEHS